MTKYRAKPIKADGLRFASQREYKRYCELKLMEKAKLISALSFQVTFPLHVKGGEEISKYIADFTYLDQDNNMVVADAKGFKTDSYRLKKKWMKAEYGIEIKEI